MPGWQSEDLWSVGYLFSYPRVGNAYNSHGSQPELVGLLEWIALLHYSADEYTEQRDRAVACTEQYTVKCARWYRREVIHE